MGTDKAAIRLSGTGKTQLVQIADSLASVVDQVLVALRDDQDVDCFPPDLPVVVDAIPAAGPLAGIVAAHRRLPRHALFVVAVDLFGFDERVASMIYHARADNPQCEVTAAAVIPPTGARRPDPYPDPLCAIWEQGVLCLAAQDFEQGERNPQVIMRRSALQLVRLPPYVVNVNTEADLNAFSEVCTTMGISTVRNRV